jgi:hypothetical protein
MFLKIAIEDWTAGKRVSRDTEETMYLRGVQHHGHHMGGSGSLDQVSHQAGSDGDTRCILLVRAGEGEIRDDGMDFPGGGGTGNIEHHQQFDQVIVYGRSERLDDVYHPRAHAGLQLDVQVIVAETPDKGLIEAQA